MNIKEGIEKRFSVRAFTKEVPDMKLISEILKTANAAPSGGNIQPWKVYVLNEQVKNNLAKETLQNFDTGVQEEIEYDIYPKPLADEYKKRRYECGADMYNALSIEKDDLDSRFKQIRDNEIVWCGVAIGYEDENHPINKYRTRRENLDSFVKFID